MRSQTSSRTLHIVSKAKNQQTPRSSSFSTFVVDYTSIFFIFTPSTSSISPTQPMPNQNDPQRPPHSRHCLHPRHRRRVPLLPPADKRNRRAGTKRSRTLEARMHKRYPEGFRQPLALNAEGQDLRADGPAFAGVSVCWIILWTDPRFQNSSILIQILKKKPYNQHQLLILLLLKRVLV